jgi:ribonuclease D
LRRPSTKFLKQKPGKGEQRTDWRRRPLTTAQINYALEDVRYLLELHDVIAKRIELANRTGWFQDEIEVWQQEVDQARSRQRWQKVSGIGNLPPRALAIVRELWLWRQSEAQQRNLPARRVLRDDLIVELAKRKSDDPEKIRAIRGMHRGAKGKMVGQLAECIRRGLTADLDNQKRIARHHMPPQLNLLGQFLSPALGSICRRANMATSLVGTASDVRELIAFRLGFGGAEHREVPALAQGWRAKLVGNLIDELLNGKKAIRIENPRSPHPIEFSDLPDRNES